MSAMDTRRATRVVANFEAYGLKGAEAKVTVSIAHLVVQCLAT
jgi:hypothetical protein